MREGRIAITGIGMASSLGNAVQACAAARAGLTRITDLEQTEVEEETLRTEALKGHPANWVAGGFEGPGRLLCLGEAAIQDLLFHVKLKPEEFAGTALLLQLPDDFHQQTLLGRGATATATSDFAPEDLPAEALLQATWKSFPERLMALTGFETRPRILERFRGGPASFAHLLLRARNLLNSRTVDRCIVGGIDSLIDGGPLLAARELQLTRTPNSPVGFLPGEAAGFVLIESARAADARGARIQALLGPVGIAEESFDRFSGTPSTGAALFAATTACLESWSEQDGAIGSAVVNLNGDPFRAMDYGSALVRMTSARLPTSFRLVLPVDSFGELGAATGPVSACMSVRSLVRGYARTPHVLVLLLDERKQRSALLLHHPGTAP
ncbi:hypothetical protein D7X74_24205 [Corallococcus sp. CA047B]|uniref:hypothetical protein n=1 Tax=Corallococcus sp. CA047B TaxID=2316729 RepID=UPI000EA2FE10|nr:hypothetical protein [Corallococcus sp. CA047B]RKH12115.1 hypothetical protein D7X74_24205 [Corallococcus sp. CA047B]